MACGWGGFSCGGPPRPRAVRIAHTVRAARYLLEKEVLTVSTVADVGAAYFDAWKAGDFARLRTILADDATFDPRPLMPPAGQ